MNRRCGTKSLLLLLFAASPIFGQTPATKTEMGAYRVPFDTEDNRIELRVANETAVAYEDVEVRLGEIPEWVDMSATLAPRSSDVVGAERGSTSGSSQNDDSGDESSIIAPGKSDLFSHSSPLKAGATRGFAFTFSVDKSAPTEEVHQLIFDIYSGGDLITTKTIDILVELPKELVLRGNYPNPFNPSTTIGFVQPEDGNITLDVFDALGRHVDRLTKDNAKRGQQTFSWNAPSRASGVYFYQLRLDSESGVKETRLGKMILVK